MAYSFYRAITIDHTLVPDDLTDFTVLFAGTYSWLASVSHGGKVQSSNGYDIGFFADASLTTKLSWEIEAYRSADGTIVAWLKVLTVSHSSDTTIYVAYGDASISTDQSNKNGTWDASYVAVLHLASTADSTGNGNGVTLQNGASFAASGLPTGTGLAVTKKSAPYQFAEISGTLGSPSAITIEGWAKITSVGADGGTLIDISNCCGIQFSTGSPQGTWAYASDGVGSYPYATEDTSHNPVGDGQYHYYVVTIGSGTLRLYIDGTQKATSSGGSLYFGTGNGGAGTVRIGADSTPSADTFSTSETVDEVRFSSVVRSAAYVSATYASVSSPSTFYLVGDEQSGSHSYTQALAEAFTIADAISRNAGKFWLSSLTITDGLVKAPAKSWLESFTLVDLVHRTMNLVRLDSFLLTEALHRLTNRSVTDEISAYDSRALHTTAAKSDVLAVLDAPIRKSLLRSLLESLNITERFRRGSVRLLALLDSFTLSDSTSKHAAKFPADILRPTDFIRRAVDRTIHETIDFAEWMRKRIQHDAIDSISYLERIVRSTSRQLADSIPPFDRLRKVARKALMDAVSLVDSITAVLSRFFSLALHESLNITDFLNKSAKKRVADALALFDSISLHWIADAVRIYVAQWVRRIFRICRSTSYAAQVLKRSWLIACVDRNFNTEFHTRNFKARKDERMITDINKPSGSTEDFMLDWSQAIVDDPITDAEWTTIDESVTVEQSSHTDTTTTVRLSGGTVGTRPVVACAATLASGQVKVQALQLTITAG